MLNYGDDGQIQEVESDEVQETIDSILEYVESRFDALDKEDRQEDIMALAQEFWEWGRAYGGTVS